MYIDLNNLSSEDQIIYNNFSVEIQDEFNLMTKSILDNNNNNTFLFSSLCSRNPYQSKLFFICLELFFIKNKIERLDKTFTFKNCNCELKKILKSSFPSHRFLFKKQYFDISATRILKDLIHNCKFTLNSLLCKSNIRKINIKKSKEEFILIDSFLLNKSFERGSYIDRYYTGILKFVKKIHQNKIFFVPHLPKEFNNNQLNNLNINSSENLLFKLDFLNFSDYFFGLKDMFFTKFVGKQYFFYEFNFFELLFKLHKKHIFNHSSFRALLNYSFIKNLNKNNLKINLFIDWHENQPIDKGINKGINDFYSNANLKGYQGYIVSREYNFYTIPTNFEIENKVVPKEIVVIGDNHKICFKNLLNQIKVSVGPAFRFSNYEMNFNESPNYITVVLPIGLKQSFNLIYSLSLNLKSNIFNNYEIILKPHPTTDLKKLNKHLLKKGINYFNFFNGPFQEILSDSLIILGNTSSALMESIVNGVPLIIIPEPFGITQNPIPIIIDNKLIKICKDILDLDKLIYFYTEQNTNQRRTNFNLGRKYKNSYYLTPTYENVNKFLNIK